MADEAGVEYRFEIGPKVRALVGQASEADAVGRRTGIVIDAACGLVGWHATIVARRPAGSVFPHRSGTSHHEGEHRSPRSATP